MGIVTRGLPTSAERNYEPPPPPPEDLDILPFFKSGQYQPTTFGQGSFNRDPNLSYGASGQMLVGGHQGNAYDAALTNLTPGRGEMVTRVGGNGGTGLPPNNAPLPVSFRGEHGIQSMVGGRGPGSAIAKLPGYVADFERSNDRTGGVRPGAVPPMNSVEDARARQRAMATPSGAPGIGGTGGVIDPSKAALNGYRDQ